MATVSAVRQRRDAPVQPGEVKQARLNRQGGSYAITIPKGWLPSHKAGDIVFMRRRAGVIEIVPARTSHTIEDEPEFALFMNHLLKDALVHPEALTPVADLFADDDDLLAGIEPAP